MRELMNRIWKKEEGFSLIELIIVIAILAIIAAIAVPNLLQNVQRANESTDESNAKLIADAIAVSIARQPDLEGTTLTTVSFSTTGRDTFTSGTDPEYDVMDGALGEFNTVPIIKSSTNGQGSTFFVSLDATGIITVYGADDAGAVDATNELYKP